MPTQHPRSKRRYTPSPPPTSVPSTSHDENLDTTLHRSAKISDRGSVFQAIYCASIPDPRSLQRLSEFASAMHKVLAWRVPGRQRTLNINSATGSMSGGGQVGQKLEKVLDTGFDNDGEDRAGRVVLKVLESEKVTGVLVVARWYGGVLLGPVRFKWIEDCARAAVKESRMGVAGNSVKKARIDEEVEHDYRTKEELESILKERDESIKVLRGLLKSKKGEKEDEGTPERRAPIYATMRIEVLRKLEGARDKTTGWLLEEISRAERETKDTSKGSVEQVDTLKKEEEKSPLATETISAEIQDENG